MHNFLIADDDERVWALILFSRFRKYERARVLTIMCGFVWFVNGHWPMSSLWLKSSSGFNV
ncbi:hypothetical protein DERF_013846 [Dermatophagoides farinae]|uniref:Uncharacterized protein n=1 Tax=Dermatophagoides farinae TaxID=6954 RepID=A0A922HNE4_DERFA|nr:hypothetical protein DERF_013846 [Dermatophagoides farinae]